MREDRFSEGAEEGIGASALADWVGKEDEDEEVGVLSVGVLSSDDDEKLGKPVLDAWRLGLAVVARGDEVDMGDRPPGVLAWPGSECVLVDKDEGVVDADELDDEKGLNAEL
ncbi:hypothetical protein DWU98_04885 [Dyella monticola]|uniref:Uncharacterized protein n=1 Tax=Dyella monticola TaxID=1927958 RepID=A0A370X5G4_9GAMM|nr:hypothetical protein [Dyella monticola]RDS83669.1 hypothetical protein DWU98_04885 [Dyella monticola]